MANENSRINNLLTTNKFGSNVIAEIIVKYSYFYK